MKLYSLFLSAFLALFSVQGSDFEPPQYQPDQSVAGQEGWQSESDAKIGIEEAAEGSQSAKISPGQSLSRSLTSQGIEFVDFYILPAFSETADEPVLKVAGVDLGFIRNDTGRSIAIFEKNETVLIPDLTFLVSAKSHPSSGWVRLTLRIDPAKKTADLYINGLPALADISLSDEKNAFDLSNFSTGDVFLDAWTASHDNPLFPDADRDGMPDAEEIAMGLNPYGDDRDGDLDGDGISNIQEFFAGTPPQIGGSEASQTSRPVLYVDNLHGNNANNGSHSYTTSVGNGPKASLKNAMASAANGTLIVVLPGKGVYQEGSRSAEGKSLTIKTVGSVTIK
jgi:hypothetical protein